MNYFRKLNLVFIAFSFSFILSFSQYGSAIDVNPYGDINVAIGGVGGMLFDSTHFEGDSTSWDERIFLARMRPNGQIAWTNSITGYNVQVYGLTSDSLKNFYVCGSGENNLNFSPSINFGKNYQRGFLAKYDSLGNCIWARDANHLLVSPTWFSGSVAQGVSVDKWGNVYLVGEFSKLFSFDFLVPFDPGNFKRSYVVKFSPQGIPLWQKQIRGNELSLQGPEITSDVIGNQYISGLIKKNILGFDTVFYENKWVATSYYNEDELYILKIDTSGSSEFICKNNVLTNSNNSYSSSKVGGIGSTGDFFFGGIFNAPVQFGQLPIMQVIGMEAAVIRIAPDGKPLWQSKSQPAINRPTRTNIKFLDTDQNGTIWAAGSYYDSIIFGAAIGLSLANDWYGNGFLVRMDENANTKCITGGSWLPDAAAAGMNGQAVMLNKEDPGTSWYAFDRLSVWDSTCGLLWTKTFRSHELIIGRNPDGNPSLEAIKVFPNPAQDQFSIELPEMVQAETPLELYSVTGKLVLKSSIEPGQNAAQITCHSLPRGIYILKMGSGANFHTRKIILF